MVFSRGGSVGSVVWMDGHTKARERHAPGRSVVRLGTMGKCGCTLVLTVASPDFTVLNTF